MGAFWNGFATGIDAAFMLTSPHFLPCLVLPVCTVKLLAETVMPRVVQGMAMLDVAHDRYLRRVMLTDIFGGLFEAMACPACRIQLGVDPGPSLASAMERRVRAFRAALMANAYTNGVARLRRFVLNELVPLYLGPRARAHGCFPALLHMTCALVARLSDLHLLLLTRDPQAASKARAVSASRVGSDTGPVGPTGPGAALAAAASPATTPSQEDFGAAERRAAELARGLSLFVGDMTTALVPALAALRAANDPGARASLLGLCTRVVVNLCRGARQLAVASGRRRSARGALREADAAAVRKETGSRDKWRKNR